MSRAAQLFVAGGSVGILAGSLLSIPSARMVALAGASFTTLGALAMAMDIANEHRYEHPRAVTAAGTVLLVVELSLVLAFGNGTPPQVLLLFSPGAFAMSIILALTGISVLWTQWKQRGSRE